MHIISRSFVNFHVFMCQTPIALFNLKRIILFNSIRQVKNKRNSSYWYTYVPFTQLLFAWSSTNTYCTTLA